MLERCHLIISGRVQGVCFRIYAQSEAQRLGLTGWCRNNPDGTVEIVADGDSIALCQFRNWCKKGPPMARVIAVKDNFSQATGMFSSFEIRY